MVCTKETVKALGLNVWVEGEVGGIDSQVDIILVEGLNAHPYYTWTGGQKNTTATASPQRKWTGTLPFRRSRCTDQTKVPPEPAISQQEIFWPRDLLHPSLPPCTISTYSYTSDWTSRDSKTDLRKYGEQFLNVVYQDRLQRKVSGRPLVLVGHSLGGLVIQQALVVAKHNDLYRDVRDSVRGVIFLGSPMQGCDAANLAAFAQRAVGNNQPLLRSLIAGSDDLLLLLRDFWDGYKHLAVVCFFEDQNSTYGSVLKIKTVGAQSATPIGGRRLYMNTDHSGLNKFTGPNDVNFQLFLPALQEVVSTATTLNVRALDITATIAQADQKVASSFKKGQWLVPFARDYDFVDRAETMARIDALLNNPHACPRVALSGLGGVGKSQIAIEHAYRMRERSPEVSIFWVHASTPARFRGSYQAIGNEVRLAGMDDPRADHLDLVYRWLLSRRSGEWLLIVDNADDMDFVRPNHNRVEGGIDDFSIARYLPQRAGGTVLFTSRDRRVASAMASRPDFAIQISPMTIPEAQQLIDKKIPGQFGDASHRYSLACQLELIPLAISQAAAYIICNQRMTIDKYLRLFNSSEEACILMLTEEGVDLRRDPEVPNSVVRTWEISFAQLRSRNTLATDLLSSMALFDREDIPEFLLQQKHNDFEFDKAIELLLGFAFVTAVKDEKMFTMHRLVHLATQEWLKSTGGLPQQREAVLKMINRVYPTGEYENWDTCQILEPHAVSALQDSYSSTQLDNLLSDLLYKRSWYFDLKGQYLLAEQLARATTRIAERTRGPKHRDTLKYMNNIAEILKHQGKLEESEKIHREVLESKDKALGSMHSSTLRSKSNLAKVLALQSKNKEAEEIHRQVLIEYKRTIGPEHHDTLTSMTNLALTIASQGRYDEAEEMHRQAYAGYDKSLGGKHPDTLTSMNNLALTLGCQGRYEEAAAMHRQALVLEEKALGPEHPHTLTSMANSALVLSDQGKWEDAEELHRRVLRIREKVLGREHPDVILSVWHLASVLARMQAYDEAYTLWQRAMNGYQKTFGQDHPNTQLCCEQFKAAFPHRVEEVPRPSIDGT